jgi:hypothetical protein
MIQKLSRFCTLYPGTKFLTFQGPLQMRLTWIRARLATVGHRMKTILRKLALTVTTVDFMLASYCRGGRSLFVARPRLTNVLSHAAGIARIMRRWRRRVAPKIAREGFTYLPFELCR